MPAWRKATCWPCGRRWPVAERITRVCDMGFTRAEFVRVLPMALAGFVIEAQGMDCWRISDPDRELQVALRIEPGPERRIGALKLPVLAVELEFLSSADALQQVFLRRFERGFHKGGG